MKQRLLASSIVMGLIATLSAGPVRAQSADDAAKQASPKDTQKFDTVTVTGSLIPQAQIEVASPTVTITAADIQRQGFATVYEALHALPQATGVVQGNQSSGGFTQAAQTISLFGLPPSFTLTLINGHPVSNYPIPYNSNANIVDLSTIPAAMVDHIDIVTGGQSALYGSSAIAGVVNIVLKEKADGVDLSFRAGGYSDGGGTNQRLQIVGGGSWGKLDAIFGLELTNQQPIFGFQRSYTASDFANPTLNGTKPITPRTFLAFDNNTATYFDPGADACNQLGYLFNGTLQYKNRPGRGFYCGTDYGVGTGTFLNNNRAGSAYSSVKYHLSETTELYTDVLFGYSAPRFGIGSNFQFWESNENLLSSVVPGNFVNANSGHIETLSRTFANEDFNGERSVYTRQINANVGVRGTLGGSDWNYDAFYNRSQVNTVDSYRNFLKSKVDDFFLGPQLGTTSGYPIYAPDRSKLYTKFNQALYNSLSARVDNKSLTWDQNLNLVVTNTSLFTLPAGDVGIAGVLRAGNEALHNPVDPNLSAGLLLGESGSSGVGTRDSYAAASELRIPVFSMLTADVSGRYDQYRFAGESTGKFTYKTGLELRPFDTLLLRADYATAFRAPDMVNLFGSSGFFTADTDYYLCRKAGFSNPYANCPQGPNSPSQFTGANISSTDLKDITAKTFTYGVVYSPTSKLTLKADYERVNIANEVQQLSIDNTLQREADCLIGQTVGGVVVDINSPSCQRYISLVTRAPATSPFGPNALINVATFPLNASSEYQSGIQTEATYALEAGKFGDFAFDLRYFVELKHTSQQFPGDPIVDQYHNSTYTSFKDIVNSSVTWNIGNWSTTVFGVRYGKIPNFGQTGTLPPWMIYNGSVKYSFASDAAISMVANNIKNSRPPVDKTNGTYPYYSTYNYNNYGRALWLQFDFHFGAKKG